MGTGFWEEGLYWDRHNHWRINQFVIDTPISLVASSGLFNGVLDGRTIIFFSFSLATIQILETDPFCVA